jgi:hypothetical protein
MNAHHTVRDVICLQHRYRNKPEGVVIGDTLHYNPYFPGGGIAMAQVWCVGRCVCVCVFDEISQALYEDVVDYDDGTPTVRVRHVYAVLTLCTPRFLP